MALMFMGTESEVFTTSLQALPIPPFLCPRRPQYYVFLGHTCMSGHWRLTEEVKGVHRGVQGEAICFKKLG